MSTTGADVGVDEARVVAVDLLGKVLIDEGSRVLVETPSYLGALQAFTPMEPVAVAVASDDEGVRADPNPEKMATLKPVFAADGVTTAANSSQISDGAAALLIALPLVVTVDAVLDGNYLQGVEVNIHLLPFSWPRVQRPGRTRAPPARSARRAVC